MPKNLLDDDELSFSSMSDRYKKRNEEMNRKDRIKAADSKINDIYKVKPHDLKWATDVLRLEDEMKSVNADIFDELTFAPVLTEMVKEANYLLESDKQEKRRQKELKEAKEKEEAERLAKERQKELERQKLEAERLAKERQKELEARRFEAEKERIKKEAAAKEKAAKEAREREERIAKEKEATERERIRKSAELRAREEALELEKRRHEQERAELVMTIDETLLALQDAERSYYWATEVKNIGESLKGLSTPEKLRLKNFKYYDDMAELAEFYIAANEIDKQIEKFDRNLEKDEKWGKSVIAYQSKVESSLKQFIRKYDVYQKCLKQAKKAVANDDFSEIERLLALAPRLYAEEDLESYDEEVEFVKNTPHVSEYFKDFDQKWAKLEANMEKYREKLQAEADKQRKAKEAQNRKDKKAKIASQKRDRNKKIAEANNHAGLKAFFLILSLIVGGGAIAAAIIFQNQIGFDLTFVGAFVLGYLFNFVLQLIGGLRIYELKYGKGAPAIPFITSFTFFAPAILVLIGQYVRIAGALSLGFSLSYLTVFFIYRARIIKENYDDIGNINYETRALASHFIEGTLFYLVPAIWAVSFEFAAPYIKYTYLMAIIYGAPLAIAGVTSGVLAARANCNGSLSYTKSFMAIAGVIACFVLMFIFHEWYFGLLIAAIGLVVYAGLRADDGEIIIIFVGLIAVAIFFGLRAFTFAAKPLGKELLPGVTTSIATIRSII